MPPLEVLARRADEINRLLRELQIKDGLRPVIVGAIMLALWNSKGEIRRDPRYILHDVNESCQTPSSARERPILREAFVLTKPMTSCVINAAELRRYWSA